MKATFISKEKNDVKFSMEFTADEFEEAKIKAYQQNKDKFSIDGFRKGKAPRSIIERHYGEGVFVEDAVNSMFSDNYSQAVQDLELSVIDNPRAEFGPINNGEGFTVTITVAVYPEINIGNYKGVEIDKADGTLGENAVQEELEKLQKRNARMVLVERPIKDGDTALIDYEGWIGDEQFQGGTAERFELKIGSGSFIPGFEEQLIGVETGGDKDVKVTFPEDYHAKDLAGKEAVFKCKVHEVKEEELPELNDEFAKDVSEFDTLEELKADTEKNLTKVWENRAIESMKNSVLEKVYEDNDIDVPDVMVESEIDGMINEFDQQLRSQGMDFQQYMGYLQKTPADFRKEMRDDAYKKVKTRMLVSAVVDKEDFQVSEDELDEQIKLMAEQYKLEPDKIREMLGEENIDYLRNDIKMRKAVDFMYENAIIK